MNNSFLTSIWNSHRVALLSALSLSVALSLALSASVSAQESGAYVGLGAGLSYADIDSGGLATAFQSGGYRISQLETEEDDYDLKIFGGYKFTPNFGLEGSYFDLGVFDFDAALLPAATHSGEVSRLRGFALDLVGTLPVREKLSAFARLGVNNAKIEQDFSGNALGTVLANRSDRGWNEKYGIGLQYAVDDVFSLRAELERYGIEDNHVLKDRVDTFTISAVFHFGRRQSAAPVVQSPAPSTPTPARTPVPARAPTLPIELRLTADAHFDFDRTELKPEGRQALDDLAQDMRTLDYDVVLVTGHTDRIGTREYNIGLSERRAETVKSYLVSVGIPAARITTRGVNSDEPITRPDQCRNTGSAQAQIACLQPDRRVVVLVSGSDDSQ